MLRRSIITSLLFSTLVSVAPAQVAQPPMAPLAPPPAGQQLPPPAAIQIPAPTNNPETDFKAYLDLMKKIISDMGNLQQEFQRAQTPDQQKAIVASFEPLRAKAMEVEPLLFKAGEAAFAQNPANKDAADFVFEALMIGNMEDDKLKIAMNYAKLLEDKGFKHPGFNSARSELAWRLNDFTTALAYAQAADKAGSTPETVAALKRATAYSEYWAAEFKLQQAETAANDLPRVKITTTKGDIVVELFENEAPNTVANFISLVEAKLYDGTAFHRVLPGFMAQVGDPNSKDEDRRDDGAGGPGYTIKCECTAPNARRHFRGSLSMAHAGPDTGGSQFYMTFIPTDHLNNKHTVFGRIIEGFDVLDSLQRIDPGAPGAAQAPRDKIVSATVLRKRNHDYKVVKGPPK